MTSIVDYMLDRCYVEHKKTETNECVSVKHDNDMFYFELVNRRLLKFP